MEMSGIDESFFDFIEQCAKDNAELIKSIEKEMEELTFRQATPQSTDGIHELATILFQVACLH